MGVALLRDRERLGRGSDQAFAYRSEIDAIQLGAGVCWAVGKADNKTTVVSVCRLGGGTGLVYVSSQKPLFTLRVTP